ncbi:hypothetical protein SCHPADRAFT_751933 [Schizopora paradoxa]|uniref:Uncharacterized protein n=1 Tax=Schizopora paradoxa TaxID=27342 RepID=A0A0H2QYR4_9AGAM|nr:hypothetical protein SCHPADRAFT_751933 [Schizopora paradoxa]
MHSIAASARKMRRRGMGREMAQKVEDYHRDPPPLYTENLWSVHWSSESSEPSKERKRALETTLGMKKKSRKVEKDDRKVQVEWVDTQTVSGTAAARSTRRKRNARLLETR